MKKDSSYVSTAEEKSRLKNLCMNMGIEGKEFIGIWAPIEMVVRFEDQPRKVFPEENVAAMSESMKDEDNNPSENKIETPVKVTPVDTPDGPMFKLVDGETRLRAAKQAGVKEIPVLVEFDLSHKEILKKSILANNCRFELSLVEQAGSYQSLIKEFGWTQERVAKEVGRHPVHVSNALKILKLHPQIRDDVLYGKIDAGYVLRLASWKRGDQIRLYKVLQKELEVHGKIPIQKVDMIVRKAAEEKGLEPLANKRGKTMKPHTVVLANSIIKKLKDIMKSLEEFDELPVEKLFALEESSVENIRSLLGQLEEYCEDSKRILNDKFPRVSVAKAS